MYSSCHQSYNSSVGEILIFSDDQNHQDSVRVCEAKGTELARNLPQSVRDLLGDVLYGCEKPDWRVGLDTGRDAHCQSQAMAQFDGRLHHVGCEKELPFLCMKARSVELEPTVPSPTTEATTLAVTSTEAVTTSTLVAETVPPSSAAIEAETYHTTEAISDVTTTHFLASTTRFQPPDTTTRWIRNDDTSRGLETTTEISPSQSSAGSIVLGIFLPLIIIVVLVVLYNWYQKRQKANKDEEKVADKRSEGDVHVVTIEEEKKKPEEKKADEKKKPVA